MKKLGFLVLAVISTQILAAEAFATTALKQVQVSNGSQVDLLFDGKVSRSQIKTEFFNDIIQISLTDVSVYPAKISSVNGGALTKIFAYQYAPKLVRCRLSVKGKAEAYKDKLAVSPSGPNGRMLTIRLDGATVARAEVKSAPKSHDDAEEAALLERVMKAPAPQAAPAAQAERVVNERPSQITDRIVEKAAAPVPAQGSTYSGESESKPVNFGRAESHLTGGKNAVPSPLGVFGKLALVVGLFSLMALGVKKFWKNKGESDNAFIGAINKFARNSLGVKAAGPRMAIEMVSNHHFGPKRSIAVVKVGGRTLVVGITEQSINLISQLSSDEDAMNALVEFDNPPLEDAGPLLNTAPAKVTSGASAAGPAVFAQAFSKTLQSESVKPAAPKAAAATAKPRGDVRVTAYGSGVSGVTGNTAVSAQAAMGLSGVRAQIRTKLEGLKEI